jgi:hypothetical protein
VNRQLGGWVDGQTYKKAGRCFSQLKKKTKTNKQTNIKIPPKDLCTWWSLSLTNYLSGCLRNTELQNAKIHYHTI